MMNEVKPQFDAVVVGLGSTGLSCVKYLSEQGLKVAVMDDDPHPSQLSNMQAEFSHVPFYAGDMDRNVLYTAKNIVLSPGVSLRHDAIQQATAQGVPVCGDIELFCLNAEAPILAITGSNGKSTVATLLAEMTQAGGLETCLGGNIGVPVLELLRSPAPPDVYVLELSSFQLETTRSLNAHASVVLNISSDHMERYDSLTDYAHAKQKIYAGTGVNVINQDDDLVQNMSDTTRDTVSFTLSSPSDGNFGLVQDGDDVWLSRADKKLIKKSELQIHGDHNVANVLAAMALAHSVGVPDTVMAEVASRFTGLPHRCQPVASINGVSWYNDSKATNVAACIAAIKSVPARGNIILIAGGDSKNADLSDLRQVMAEYVQHVLLLGVDAKKLAEVIEAEVPITFVEDMKAAVTAANTLAKPHDLVLLAPACSSLDRYANYEQRGDDFVAQVDALRGVA